MKRSALMIALIALTVCVLDQAHKYWMLEIYGVAAKSPVILHEYFALVMTWNKGVSFSMFSQESDCCCYFEHFGAHGTEE
jgi:signal peptidase II